MSTTEESIVIGVPLDSGIEARGIERVLPHERTHVSVIDNFTMWLSANMVISTVALGALAIPVFGLGFWDSLAVIVLFNMLGVLPVAYFSTLGPRLGLRQMTIARFSFGWHGAKIMALFNVAACIGWSAVNVIVGSQIITALSKGAVPVWASILVIAALTTAVSVYGYRYVHRYERFAWIPMAVIFFIVAASTHGQMGIVPTPAWNMAHIASLVSFGGAIYGFATGWSSYAADYSVNQPEHTPASKIFWLTFFGVTIPCILLETVGLGLTTVSAFGKAANEGGGALLAAALHPLGGLGEFLLLLLALSVIANNIPNDYSLGLSIQVLGRAFHKVNRAVWTFLGAVVYIVIAIFAAAHFNATLENFLLMVAYWLSPWTIILILEHFIVRRGQYNLDSWNEARHLPVGWAAIVSMALGLFGVYLGAAQLLFVGPIAGLFNPPYGMDVGFELGLVFAAVSYLILRPIELRKHAR
ncbi:MAG: cytosine permease [Acidihalobacter sp.]|jgi:NCS1 nucleoside transporter family|uniref:cytosine permease n=1 Tax=Acidihalobacter sp. TaxID=1872108 RepID=UPI00307D5505